MGNKRVVIYQYKSSRLYIDGLRVICTLEICKDDSMDYYYAMFTANNAIHRGWNAQLEIKNISWNHNSINDVFRYIRKHYGIKRRKWVRHELLNKQRNEP